MPRADSLVSVEIDTLEKVRKIADPDAETPFHILVAGNFSGGAGRHRKAVGIDRDDFDIVMAFLSPEAQVSAGGVAAGIRFEEIDDFHPDRLFQNVEAMRALRNLRKRLVDPATFAAAAAEFFPRQAPGAEPAAELHGKSGADLLRMMLGEASVPGAAPARSDWEEMLRRLVAPYVVPNPDPRQADLVAQTDAAIAGYMRSILHDRAFQALESAWRGLFFLSRRLETGEHLKIFVLDLPQEELATEEGIAALTRALAEGEWSAIAGLWNFAPSDEPVLTRLAALARKARAPLIAGLAPDVVGLSGYSMGCAMRPMPHGWVWRCRASYCGSRTAPQPTRSSRSHSKRCRLPRNTSAIFGAIPLLPAPVYWARLSPAMDGRCGPAWSTPSTVFPRTSTETTARRS